MNIQSHLLDRRVDLALHRCWIDEQAQISLFPLYNMLGQIVGCQQYRPSGSKAPNNDPREGRYFTRCWNPPGMWGLESLHLSRTIFVCEGLFDAAAFTSAGASAVAIFTSSPSHCVRSQLSLLGRPLVAVLDNDSASRNMIRNWNIAHHVVSGYHDAGEASTDYIDSVIRKYTI